MIDSCNLILNQIELVYYDLEDEGSQWMNEINGVNEIRVVTLLRYMQCGDDKWSVLDHYVVYVGERRYHLIRHPGQSSGCLAIQMVPLKQNYSFRDGVIMGMTVLTDKELRMIAGQVYDKNPNFGLMTNNCQDFALCFVNKTVTGYRRPVPFRRSRVVLFCLLFAMHLVLFGFLLFTVRCWVQKLSIYNTKRA